MQAWTKHPGEPLLGWRARALAPTLAIPAQALLLFLGGEPRPIELSFRNAVNWYKPSCLAKLFLF